TSYPHEILHNWWGNSVYIDPRSGNWAEGLTAYLSDQLMAELAGNGDKYRFQELVKYLNYVKTNTDFPLSEFRFREDMASQAIGYGKTLMMFHMLRTELGDSVFLQGLRHFYQNRQFCFAGFDDIRAAFETVSGKNLLPFFHQWITRKGAPELQLALAVATVHDGKPTIMLEVRQTQSGPVFPLALPVAVWTNENEDTKFTRPHFLQLRMDRKMQTFNNLIPGLPFAVRLDPYNEVFRKPNRKETPASIGQTYGSEKLAVILPTDQPASNLHKAYIKFAKAIADDNADAESIIATGDFAPAPGKSHWILGRNHKATVFMRDQLEKKGVAFDPNGIKVDGKYFPWSNHSFVFTVRHPEDFEQSLTWVAADSAASVPGLIRKLPHYGKYSFLVFEGEQPTNRLKGIWPSTPMGLMKIFVPGNYSLPPQTPLTSLKPGKFE
ncbi:MAG: M1 family aminopeptidase, partial [Nitrospinales bacterium]